MIRKLVLAAIVAASFGSFALPAAADIVVRLGPPEPRAEAAPPPRRGFFWVPGYWTWSNRQHQWVAGHYVRERNGYVYDRPTWTERNGRWHMEQGNWRRGDRDRDGIPNRFDRDRDGDGVPNRYDRSPDNRNRS